MSFPMMPGYGSSPRPKKLNQLVDMLGDQAQASARPQMADPNDPTDPPPITPEPPSPAPTPTPAPSPSPSTTQNAVPVPTSKDDKTVAAYLKQLIAGGMKPQEAIDKANKDLGLVYGSSPAYYPDRNMIGLTDLVMEGDKGWDYYMRDGKSGGTPTPTPDPTKDPTTPVPQVQDKWGRSPGDPDYGKDPNGPGPKDGGTPSPMSAISTGQQAVGGPDMNKLDQLLAMLRGQSR